MRNRRRTVLIALVTTGAVVLGAGASALGWDRDELGPPATEEPPALGDREIRAVTFNAFRLSQTPRVDGVLDAVAMAGAELGSGPRDRPELVAVQELESRAAVRALSDALSDTHRVHVCECAEDDDGSLRSAVALAADPRVFAVRGHRCIPLGRLWPDHPRCAVEAELGYGERTLRVVSVHMAWHPDNAPMAERLRSELDEALARDETVVVLGDLNTWPDSDAYRTLVGEPVRDACVGAPATHFTGHRLDYVLVGPGVDVVRTLDRRACFDALHPTTALWLPSTCEASGPPDCPVSDHLPEGAVLRLGSPGVTP